MPRCSALTRQMVNERATVPHKPAPTSRNPAARQACRPSAGRTERASRSRLPVAADNPPAFRLRLPDTSTEDRPYPVPFGCKPRACGHAACLPARMGGGGKAESSPWRGPAGAQRPPHGGDYSASGNERAKPLAFPPIRKRRRSASPAATRLKNGTLARPDASRTPCARACGPAGVR
jgi:hypothetical protein